jgi:hypothetical protein
MINSHLTPPQAVRYINTWLTRNNYSDVFKNDIGLLLSENRRVTRSAGVIKYGRIPFSKKDGNGRITYQLEDLQDLCNNKIKPICEPLAKIRDDKATKASRTARKPYYEVLPVISDEKLDQLLSELD